MIWNEQATLELLQKRSENTLTEHLGIEFTQITDSSLSAKMPVDHRTKQPMGLLHGGASCVLAETLGSVCSVMVVDLKKQSIVGLEINANHIKSAKDSYVYGHCTPIHIGKKTHVWHIEIHNEKKEMVCIARLTTMILDL
jgi:1,4-dihydroxy-2-naphthoyl-CoA hydrolase